jgi:hypothetical protein
MLPKREFKYSKAVVQYIGYVHTGEYKPKGNYVISYDDVITEHWDMSYLATYTSWISVCLVERRTNILFASE